MLECMILYQWLHDTIGFIKYMIDKETERRTLVSHILILTYHAKLSTKFIKQLFCRRIFFCKIKIRKRDIFLIEELIFFIIKRLFFLYWHFLLITSLMIRYLTINIANWREAINTLETDGIDVEVVQSKLCSLKFPDGHNL